MIVAIIRATAAGVEPATASGHLAGPPQPLQPAWAGGALSGEIGKPTPFSLAADDLTRSGQKAT